MGCKGRVSNFQGCSWMLNRGKPNTLMLHNGLTATKRWLWQSLARLAAQGRHAALLVTKHKGPVLEGAFPK